MRALHQALYTFWSGFHHGSTSIPAYLTGHVPDDAAFPYITFEVVEGGFGGATLLTAIVWCKDGSGASVNAQRAAILDEIRAAIPESGRVLRFTGGACVLYPNDANFLSYYDDPEDKTVLGGRVSVEAHYYIN